jgi:DnaJ-class molecular chaperone
LPTHALAHRLEQATQADIKKVYRKLSQTYHPDVNQEPGAQERFIEISQAYSILGDDEERYAAHTCVSAHIQGC